MDWVLRDPGYDGNWVREMLKKEGLCADLRGRTQNKMFSPDPEGATKLRLCLAGLKAGGVSQPE